MTTAKNWQHKSALIVGILLMGVFISHGQVKSMAFLLDSCNMLRKTGNLEAAFDLAYKIESTAKIENDSLALCTVNLELGVLYGRTGELGKSNQRFENILRIARMVKSDALIAKALNNLGGNYLLLEKYDSALLYLSEAKEIKWVNGDISGYANTCLNLSTACRLSGQNDLAFSLCQESLDLLRKEANRSTYYTALANYASLYMDVEEYQTADSLLHIVLDLELDSLYRIEYLQALEAYSVLLYNRDLYRAAYDTLEAFVSKSAEYVGDKTRARIQELEVQHAKAEKQIEVDRAELLAEKRKSKILVLLVGLVVAVVAALLWVSKVRSRSRERTRILNQSYERETKRISDLVWHEIALSVDGKGSSLASGKEMSQEALRGAMGALEYLRNQQKNPYLQVGLNRALEDLFVPRSGTAIQVTHQMDEVKMDKKFRVTAFRIIEALFNNCLDSIRSGELRIEMHVVDKKLEITFDVPGIVLDKSALHMAAEARLHQVKGKLKSRPANAGTMLEVTIPLPKTSW